ncbi:SusC/RagA family TonB-linked outer membrane protein [Sphingobacterium griseoflavum]|nr:SusC/RagA family TonB-linked outer membrane protein [Sphingobacterium griseoflavum]
MRKSVLFSFTASVLLNLDVDPVMANLHFSFMPTNIHTLQQERISGVVRDANGPVSGVTVSIVGTSSSTMTGVDGSYAITAPNNAILRYSSVGYKSQEVRVSGNSINVLLEIDENSLEQVVVVGYGQQKKANLTGAVSSVDVEKTLGSRPIPDFARGLQGAVPGLSIQVPSGEVGSNPVMRIRGQIASQNGSSNPLILVDNVEVPNVQVVNPDDIENITVLKDAAASSIYGAKAAFGVVLITTKKGAKTDRNDVTYSGNYSFQSPFTDIQLAGIEGLQYTLDAHDNMKQAGPAGGFWRLNWESFEKIKEWQEKYGGTVKNGDPVVYGRDWYFDGVDKYGYRVYDAADAMIKDRAFSHLHNIGLNGKRGDTQYNFSVGYLGQEGMMKPAQHDDYQRFTSNLNVSTKVSNYLTLRGGAMYADGTKRYPNSTNSGGFTADPWLYLYRWSSLFPIGVKENGVDLRDPATDASLAHTTTKRDRFINLNLGTTVQLTKSWDLKADYAYTSQINSLFRSQPTITAAEPWYSPVIWNDDLGNRIFVDENGNPTDTGGIPGYKFPLVNYGTKANSYVYRDAFEAQKHTFNAFTTYQKSFADVHDIKIMAGTNIVADNELSNWSNRTELINNDNPQFNFATGVQTAGGTADWQSQFGVFGRVNYAYKDKYLLEGNIRYDGTSLFPERLRWRWYPSASAGWVLSNESFMEPIRPVLSFLKLRGSYGIIGDQSVSNGLYWARMNIAQNNWLSSDGQKFFQLGTPNLISDGIGWQNIEHLNVGADVRLFNNKLGFVFEWFQRSTTDMIIAGDALPATLGAPAPNGNYGDLRTRGWEIAADYSLQFESGLRLTMNANLADAVTMITRAADQNTPFENRNIHNTWVTGKRYGDVYGYVTDRLYQKDDFIYDANGNFTQTTIVFDGNAKRTNMLAGNNPVYQTFFEDGNQILLMSPGDVKFVDVNGDGYITPGNNTFGNMGDQVVIGNTTPRYDFGFRLGAEYKGFDFAVFVQGIGERKIWGDGQLAIPGYFAKEGGMPKVFATDYWREDRTDAFYPRAWNYNGSNSSFVMRPQTRYMLDMAYVRIKNINFGYSVPTKVLNRMHLSRARIYVSLENMFTFDNLRGLPIDPETISGNSMLLSNGNYNLGRTGTANPAFKSASMGIQIGL